MYPTLLDLAIFGYIAATGLSLAYLVQREEWLHRVASVATIAGWVLHAVALLALAFRLGRPPLGSLSEAVSVAVWVAVLWALWVERQYGVKVLGAFVLPVVLVFGINSTPTRPLARRRMDLGAHRVGPARHRGIRPELRRGLDVCAPGAPAQGEASGQALL